MGMVAEPTQANPSNRLGSFIFRGFFYCGLVFALSTCAQSLPTFNALSLVSSLLVQENPGVVGPTGPVSISTGNGVLVNETGGFDTYSVVLTIEPTDDVIVTPTGDSQINLGPALTFTTGNWDTPQTIQVSAVDDALAEGNHSTTITHTSTSTDPTYDAISVASVTVSINDNDVPGITLIESAGSTDITEGSGSDTYTIELNTNPTNVVDIEITPSSGVAVNGSTIPFTINLSDTTAANLTVTLANIDNIDKGSIIAPISYSVTSLDGQYDATSIPDTSVNVTDDDVAGVSVSLTSMGLSEPTGTSTYDVVLTSEPTGNVTVTLDFDGQLLVDSAGSGSMTFTSGNWNTPQTVDVNVKDDSIAEGTHSSTITHTVTSGDSKYEAFVTDDVVVTITDNDTVGVTVTESFGSTQVAENGSLADSYTIVLTSEPTSSVDIDITATEVNVNGGSTQTLTFTTANWNTPKVVNVTGRQDSNIEGPHTGSITHAATSSDLAYQGISIANVAPDVCDDDLGDLCSPVEVSGMVAWFKAEDLAPSLTNLQPVTNWPDASGNGNNAQQVTVGNQPRFETAIFGGQPGVRFGNSGVDDFLQTPSISLTSFTVFMVFKMIPAAPNAFVYEHSLSASTNDGSWLFTSNTNSTRLRRNGGTISEKNTSAAWGGSNVNRLVTQIYGGSEATHQLSLDGIVQTLSIGVSGNPTGSATAPLFLGGRSTATLGMNGYIGEMIIFDSALSALQRQGIECYLGAKYGITVLGCI